MARETSAKKEPALSTAAKTPRAVAARVTPVESSSATPDALHCEWPLKPEKVPNWNRTTLRFCLGQAQMWGTIATFLLLVQGGRTDYVIAGVGITTLFSVISLVLFRVVWKDQP